MMLKVINSGSKANGYLLESENEALLLEAGCKLLDVKKVLDWQIRKLVGCVVSHSHPD